MQNTRFLRVLQCFFICGRGRTYNECFLRVLRHIYSLLQIQCFCRSLLGVVVPAWRIFMEPEHDPLEKETLAELNHPFLGSTKNFSGNKSCLFLSQNVVKSCSYRTLSRRSSKTFLAASLALAINISYGWIGAGMVFINMRWQIKDVEDQQFFLYEVYGTQTWKESFPTYCWWKKSCTTWDIWNPVNNGIFTISTGAGCLPSTVSQSPYFFATPPSLHPPPWGHLPFKGSNIWQGQGPGMPLQIPTKRGEFKKLRCLGKTSS